jgi:predicted  nucleic acid-binding Zn-ribbon protein
LNKALNEKNLLALELNNLQEHYEKAQQAGQDRIRTLEERLAQQQRLYKQLDETSKASYERSKRDHSEEVKEISRDYESKLESAEDLIHQLRGNKDALEKEISNLRASINQLKVSHRDEISDAQDKVREEETQKFNNTLRNLEQRMKSVEEARETLTKRNQDLQREMLRNEKRNMEQILSLEATVNHLRDDKAELQDQLHNALNTIEMLRNEIQMNNSTIERLQNENEELTVTMNQRKEAHLEQLEQMANEHFSEKKKLEYAKEMLNNRLNDLEKQLSSAVVERDRNLRDLEKLAEDLKTKLGNYVQDAILNHVRKQEEDKY